MASPSTAYGSLEERNREDNHRILEMVLIPVALLFDLFTFILRTLLKLAVPLVFISIGWYLVTQQFMKPGKDTSTVSNTVTALLVALGSLGFTWAAAVDRDNPDYAMIMSVSRQFMLSAMALILGTGFKYVLRTVDPGKHMVWGGGILHTVLTLLMICFFLQAFLESLLPVLKLYRHLASHHGYRSGMHLLRKHMPGYHDKFARFLGLENGNKNGKKREP